MVCREINADLCLFARKFNYFGPTCLLVIINLFLGGYLSVACDSFRLEKKGCCNLNCFDVDNVTDKGSFVVGDCQTYHWTLKYTMGKAFHLSTWRAMLELVVVVGGEGGWGSKTASYPFPAAASKQTWRLASSTQLVSTAL